MSPRAFRTMLVGPMGAKDRLELESRVLAAALKQSVELGDSAGVSLAHKQIFLHIRSAHGAGSSKTSRRSRNKETRETDTEVSKVQIKKNRKLPNIVWTEAEEDDQAQEQAGDDVHDMEPADETVEIPLSASKTIDDIQQKAIEASNRQSLKPQEEVTVEQESSQPAQAASVKKTEDIDLGKSKAAEEIEKANIGSKAELPEEGVFDAYGILGIEQVASFEQIHVAFLVSVRKLLFSLKKTRKRKRKELLAFLQELWIAHDVLTDPVTRTDYDFRILGLRGAPDVIIDTPENEGQVVIGSAVPLRIGELLQCAGLLEPTELEIAADMHKAMPEMLFGSFLVKQGFITETDLEQVLMGQRLLKMGYMSVATFRGSMKQWIDSETPIYESAVADGLLTISEMERIIAQGLRDTDTEIPAFQGTGQVGIRSSGRGKIQSVGSGPMINQEEATKRNVSANNAVPEWKDQLDWSAPPEEEVKKTKKTRTRKRTTIDTSAYQIEGITTESGKSDSSRKSLRSLMKGMHLDDEAEESEEDEASTPSVFDFGGEANEKADSQTDQEQSANSDEDVIKQLTQTYGNIIQVNSEGKQDTGQTADIQNNIQVGKLSSDTNTASSEQETNVYDEEDTEETEESIETHETVIEPAVDKDEQKQEHEQEQQQEVHENSFDEDEDIADNAYDEEDEPMFGFQDGFDSDSKKNGSEESHHDSETFTDLDQVPDSKVEMKISQEQEKIEPVKPRLDETGDNYDAVLDQETADEIRKLSSQQSKDISSSEDPEEATRQALKKSLEWQVMYKIKGNLADVLLSDSEEPDVPPLAPRLEDIDVIPKGYSSASEDEGGEAGDSTTDSD